MRKCSDAARQADERIQQTISVELERNYHTVMTRRIPQSVLLRCDGEADAWSAGSGDARRSEKHLLSNTAPRPSTSASTASRRQNMLSAIIAR